MIATSALFMKILLLMAGHFIGDFAFQSTWMAMEKGRDWEVLFYHVAVYTATIGLLGLTEFVAIGPVALALVFVTHYVLDALKGRYHVVKQVWQDQALHIAVLIALAAVGLL